ncbi:MAG: hypothetical protein Kow0022_07490 [Phycisphaerales bacterium]
MSQIMLACVLAALLAGPSPSQTRPTTAPAAQPQTTPTSTKDHKDWGVRLAPDPIYVESAGVTISVPVDAVIQQDVYETITSTKILLANDLGIVVVQERRSRNLELETTEVADEILTQLLALAPKYGLPPNPNDPDIPRDEEGRPLLQITGSRAQVFIRNKQYQVGGLPADHAYVAIPNEGSPGFTIRGSTLLKTSPGRFILFQLFCAGENFAKAREVYEVMLATVQLEDPADVASRRAASVDAGVKALAQLTESDYRQVFEANPERWERFSQSAPAAATGDEKELGYRRIRAKVGQRGELSPNKPREKWDSDDLQEGFIVMIDARLLDQGSIIDTRSAYFLSLDRQEETWVVNMAVRKNGNVDRWQEIGARRGKDMSISIVPESLPATKIRPLIQGDGYISMVESFMLPQLLVHVGIPADFAFYSYQTSSGTIRLRTDSLDQPAGPGGQWVLTTHLNADAPPQTTILTADGKFVRTEMSEGRRWSIIEFDQLYRLWKSKGLPLN